MEIRRATENDLEGAVSLLEMGRKNILELGIDQWQNGDPSAEDIKRDVEDGNCYVAVEDKTYYGTLYIGFEGEQTYKEIDGEWLQSGEYATLHRVAVNTDYRGKGIFAALVDYATLLSISRGIHALRIDTHRGNTPMRAALVKNGFHPCGVIKLLNGDERVAYEKIV